MLQKYHIKTDKEGKQNHTTAKLCNVHVTIFIYDSYWWFSGPVVFWSTMIVRQFVLIIFSC